MTATASLFVKQLERARFLWPSVAGGIVTIAAAQLSYLLFCCQASTGECLASQGGRIIAPAA
jgi:hypothetical protein